MLSVVSKNGRENRQRKTVGWGRLFGFASPWYPLGAVTLPLTVFLPPLYAGRTGLGLVLVGQIVMAARLLDLIVDPFIGAASDATISRFGRRKPWIVAGLPIFCIGVFFLFNPPFFSADQTAGLFSFGGLYLAGSSIMTALGGSLMLVPHTAWSSELSEDYNERSRIMGTNEWINLIGILGVAIVGAVLEQTLHAGLDTQMRFMAIMLVATAPLSVAVCTFIMPEPAPRRRDRYQAGNAGTNIFTALRNRLFFRLAGVKFVNSVAESIAQSLWVFVCASVLDLASSATTLLAIHIAMGFASIPLWTWLSYRLGKRSACMLALMWRVVLTPLILILPQGNFTATAIFMITVGLSLGVESSLLRAMVADVVDHNQMQTGHKQAGLFQGAFNVISNIGKALGVGFAYPMLAVLGYGGAIHAERSSSHGQILLPALFYAFIPPLLNLIGVLALSGFRLSRRDVEAIQIRLRKEQMPSDHTEKKYK